jgi:hypothetical protein
MKTHLFASLILIPFLTTASSPSIRISQIYGGGGNTGATYTNDFVELYNYSASTINLSGWSLQYAAPAGASWTSVSLNGFLTAGHYYLVQLAAGGGGTTTLPPADAISTLNINATSGKVAVVNSQGLLSGSCPSDGSIVDLVGYGTVTTCYEGAPSPSPNNLNSILRLANGCSDTDFNSTDFEVAAPNPRNSASPQNACGATFLNELLKPQVNINLQGDRIHVHLEGPQFDEAYIELCDLSGRLISRNLISNVIYEKDLSEVNQSYLIVRVLTKDYIVVKPFLLKLKP